MQVRRIILVAIILPSLQMEDYLRALETTVTDEDRKRVDTIFEPGTHVSNYYSADFGPNARWQ